MFCSRFFQTQKVVISRYAKPLSAFKRFNTSNQYSKEFFQGSSQNVKWFLSIAGATGIGGLIYFRPKGHTKEIGMKKGRNYSKFIDGHHVPLYPMKFPIDRTDKESLIEKDIIEARMASRVINIVGFFLIFSLKLKGH